MKVNILISSIVIIICILFMVIKFNFLKKDTNFQIELTYEINAGIPFRWEYEIEDKDIVGFVKSYVVRDDNKGAIVGASVYTNYVFKGLKEGETTIIFKYVNITDGIVSMEKKHKVRVDSNKRIFEI